MLKSLCPVEASSEHHLVLRISEPSASLIGYVSFHGAPSQLYPALGATRILTLGDEDLALTESLRLSKLMSYKAAASGLMNPGAKAVLVGLGVDANEGSALDEWPESPRHRFLRAYAEAVTSLKGLFFTGADAGVTFEDLRFLCDESPYFLGRLADPVVPTATGLLVTMRYCARRLLGREGLQGLRVGIMGLGKVGLPLARMLAYEGAEVLAADASPRQVKKATALIPGLQQVASEELACLPLDVFAPCALGQAIHRGIIEVLNCQVVLGGANDQLADPECANRLQDRGIAYVPDYLVNAGGLMTVAAELRGDFPAIRPKEHLARVSEAIVTQLAKVFDISEARGCTLLQAADALCSDVFRQRALGRAPVGAANVDHRFAMESLVPACEVLLEEVLGD